MIRKLVVLSVLSLGLAQAALQKVATVTPGLQSVIEKAAERTTGRKCIDGSFSAYFDQDNGRISKYAPAIEEMAKKEPERYQLISSDWERKLVIPGDVRNSAIWNIVIHDNKQEADIYLQLTNLNETTMTYALCALEKN